MVSCAYMVSSSCSRSPPLCRTPMSVLRLATVLVLQQAALLAAASSTCEEFDLSDVASKIARARAVPLTVGFYDESTDSTRKPMDMHVARVFSKGSRADRTPGSLLEPAWEFLWIRTEYAGHAVTTEVLRGSATATEGVAKGSRVFIGVDLNSTVPPRGDAIVPSYDVLLHPGKLRRKKGRFGFYAGTGVRLEFIKQRIMTDADKAATYDVDAMCDKLVDVLPEIHSRFIPSEPPVSPVVPLRPPVAEMPCYVVAPYIHGVSAPPAAMTRSGAAPDLMATAPWDLPLNRSTLMTFCGSVQRSTLPQSVRSERSKAVTELLRLYGSDDLRLESGASRSGLKRMFSAPMHNVTMRAGGWGSNPKYYQIPWESYATSDFSYQPHGDTATRRAFFDSWMFGCIPIIDTRAAYFYSGLFRGLLFDGKRRRLQDVAVVLDEETFQDAEAVMKLLKEMPEQEVACRRRRLRQLAPLLQWGHAYEGETGHSAFDMVLASFVK